MSTKLKIIVVVFAILAGIYAIQFAITSVSSNSKREAFENEDDEIPNEPKKKSSTTAKKAGAGPSTEIKDKEVKLHVLEILEDIFNKKHPDSDKKPVVFDMLMQKEHFDELKDLHRQEKSLSEPIEKMIKTVMSQEEKDDDKKEEFEVTEKAIEKLEMLETKKKFMNELEEIATKISTLREELKKIKVDEGFEAAGSPSPAPSKAAAPPSTAPPSTTASKPLIEGFENRINYALY